MKNLVLLIKPASGFCNLQCKYCFYCEESKMLNVHEPSEFMSDDTLEQTVKRAFEIAENKCTFVFQGGEPTLRNVEFYKRFEEYVLKYNEKSIEVERFFQTNGYAIDEEYAEFFLKSSYYVGVSIDGNESQHDRFRLSQNGIGTHKKVLESIKLLLDYGVDVSALVTVTDNNCENGSRLYRYIKSLGIKKIQFTKYISVCDEIHLTPSRYGRFLIAVFDEYVRDLISGKQMHIREFDNFILLCGGKRSEICGGDGVCRSALTVEADGSVYPCDFYVGEDYRLGNVFDDSFENIYESDGLRAFVQRSLKVPNECKNCQYFKLCKNGCYRYRKNDRSRFCESYKMFFKYAEPYLKVLSENIR